MRFDSLLAATGAAPNLISNILLPLYLLAGICVYVSLIRQISARTSSSVDEPKRTFGLPEAILAGALIFLLLLNVSASVSNRSVQLNPRNLLENLLFTFALVLFIATFLRFRGFDLSGLGGFSKITFPRALSTGIILILAAYPLIALTDAVTQRLFG